MDIIANGMGTDNVCL